MARTIWTGTISFGLVSVRVGLYTATDKKDVSFHQFERGTDQRVRYKRVAEGTDREVDYSDVVKGYGVSGGEYVMLTQDELEAAEPGRSRAIEIEDFVELDEIDPIYYEKTYYLRHLRDCGLACSHAARFPGRGRRAPPSNFGRTIGPLRIYVTDKHLVRSWFRDSHGP